MVRAGGCFKVHPFEFFLQINPCKERVWDSSSRAMDYDTISKSVSDFVFVAKAKLSFLNGGELDMILYCNSIRCIHAT